MDGDDRVPEHDWLAEARSDAVNSLNANFGEPTVVRRGVPSLLSRRLAEHAL